MKSYKIKYFLPIVLAAFFITSCQKKAEIKQPENCTADFFYGNGLFRTDSFTTIQPEYTEGNVVDGSFQASSSGLIIDPVTGQIDVANSAPGGYNVRKMMTNTPCGKRIAQAYITILPPAPKPVQLHSADNLTGWNFNGVSGLDAADKKEGSASVKIDLVGNPLVAQINFAPAINVQTTRALGELRFWFYISAPLNLSQTTEVGQFELTSSGGPDNKEYTWRIIPERLNLAPGWNYLTLRFRDAEITGGEPDLSAISFFRCYMFANTGPLKIGFDDIKVYNGQ